MGEFMNYKIEIKETLSRIIDIEADNEEGAIRKAKEQYRNQNVILDSGDYIETKINVYNQKDTRNEKKLK